MNIPVKGLVASVLTDVFIKLVKRNAEEHLSVRTSNQHVFA